jgi:hypothetical protein
MGKQRDLITRNVKHTVRMIHLVDHPSALRAKCTDEYNVYLIQETPDKKVEGMTWQRTLVTWSFATFDEAKKHYDMLSGKA